LSYYGNKNLLIEEYALKEHCEALLTFRRQEKASKLISQRSHARTKGLMPVADAK
jgi:hypothetical protein